MLPLAPGRLSTTIGLAEHLVQASAQQPRQDIGGAAGGIRHDDAHGFRLDNFAPKPRLRHTTLHYYLIGLRLTCDLYLYVARVCSAAEAGSVGFPEN